MTELEVPARAWELFKLYADSVTDQVPACVADIAAPIVAAELRRVAALADAEVESEELAGPEFFTGAGRVLGFLTDRADELDPEGKP